MKKIVTLFIFVVFNCAAQNPEMAFKTYTINGGFCKGIQTHWGSLLFIPDNCFSDESGNTCNSVITIKYREFHSQTDMFYSGLNMILEKGTKYYLLESIGMFEIEAWCSDKRLFLREGKQIQVRMKTKRNLKDVSSFIYNSEKNLWNTYDSPVIDFSYFDKRNNADSLNYWGSGRVSAATATVDVEMESAEMYNPVTYFNKMPEGYFKGMNIKKLGIFNYDAIMKDSLAIPMIPELLLRGGNTPIEQKLYVTYPNKNTLVYYFPSDFKERFVLLNQKGIKMFTESKDGVIAITNDSEINKLNLESYRQKTIPIYFDPIPAKPKNAKELSAATGLKTE
ncbi:MAG: hypothetical protein IPM51_00935 [Sphingobacteriaceae bacterium]|nr:hypothetical protein [Sphingobacteriaceae bacterium]